MRHAQLSGNLLHRAQQVQDLRSKDSHFGTRNSTQLLLRQLRLQCYKQCQKYCGSRILCSRLKEQGFPSTGRASSSGQPWSKRFRGHALDNRTADAEDQTSTSSLVFLRSQPCSCCAMICRALTIASFSQFSAFPHLPSIIGLTGSSLSLQVGEDAAAFDPSKQSTAKWTFFTVELGVVLAILYAVRDLDNLHQEAMIWQTLPTPHHVPSCTLIVQSCS